MRMALGHFYSPFKERIQYLTPLATTLIKRTGKHRQKNAIAIFKRICYLCNTLRMQVYNISKLGGDINGGNNMMKSNIRIQLRF